MGLGLFLAPAVLSFPVPAQDPPAASEQEEQERSPPEQPSEPPEYEERILVEGRLEEIPTASNTWGKREMDLLSTPASVGVVPRSLFASQDGVTLSDALRNVAGIDVATGFGVFDVFVIRGFDSLETGLVLTDGAAEPESTFYPLYNLERVEVLKGPAAFLYGGNPLSGTVNLVRKQPVFDDFGAVELSYGHFQSYEGTVDLNVARTDQVAALRVNAYFRDSERYRDDKDGSLVALNPSLTINLNETTPLTLNVEYVASEYQPDSGLPLLGNEIPDVPRTRSYQSPFDVSDQSILRFRLDLSSEIRPDFTIRTKTYVTDLDWQSDGTLLNGAFPNLEGGTDVFRVLTLLDDRQRFLGNQLEALGSVSTGPLRHRWLVGLETARLADKFTLDVAALPTIDLFDPVETAQRPLFLLPGQSQAADARSIVVAPYFFDQMEIHSAVQVLIGGRWDHLDYDDRRTGTSRDTSKFSPLLGAVFSPRPHFSFYAQTGRAFAPPSTRVVGEREPEESRQFEIGVKKRLGQGKGLATAAWYHLERENVGIPDRTGITRQNGAQRSRGLELELLLEPVSDWFTFASYAYNRSELTEFSELLFTGAPPPFPPFVVLDHTGNRAPFAPRHILNVWTMGEIGSWGVGIGARYVSSQFIAPDNAYAIPEHVTLDARVSYTWKRWTYSLNLKNLTNRDYETRGFGSSAVIPADPFAAYGSIGLRFGL